MKIFFAILFIIAFSSCEVSINKDHVAEGTRLLQQGEFFKADLEFDDALFADRNNLDALRGSYMCAINMGNFEKAMERTNKFIDLKPDSSVGYNDRGTIFLYVRNYDKALSDFDAALKYGTDQPLIALFNKGEALRELDRDKEAIACFQTVIANDKTDARAFFKLGQSYSKLGAKDSACFSFRTAMDLGDEDAKIEYTKNCK